MYAFLYLSNHFIFTHILDNLCQNALDLTNSKLIIDNNWPLGTYCQWLISAEDENSYITLEFQNINVSNEIFSFKMFCHTTKTFHYSLDLQMVEQT